MIGRKYTLFGSEAEFYVDAEEFIAEPLMKDAYALALRLQKIFNIYDESSEISMLNRNRQIKASPEMIEVLSTALKLCELSGGEYDISLGKQFLQRKNGQELTVRKCSYKDIQIDGDTIRLLHDDAWLDLGSIAKGYIGERICLFFQEQGIVSGYIDARGDLRIFGEPMYIDVQHPRNNGMLLSIKVKDKGVATSGDYNQYNKSYDSSHILNKKEIISATVISDDLMHADAYATILMVCDPDTRERIIIDAGYHALTIDKDLNIKYYNGFENIVINKT